MKIPIARLLPLYVVIFFGLMGYSMMLTLFTPLFMYAQEGILPVGSTLGYRVVMLGVYLALFPCAQFFGAPILGTFSDRFGRRKVLLFSLSVAAICYAGIAFSLKIHNLTLLAISTLIAGFSEANIVTAQGAITDVVPKQERTRFFGYIGLSASSAFIVGPIFGGWLADSHLVSWFDYDTPFWIVAILILGTLFWIRGVFKDTILNKIDHISYKDAFTNLFTIFTSKKLRSLYLINFLIYFVIFGFFRCYPMYIVNAYHVDVAKLSLYIAWVSLPIIIVNLGVIGWLAKKYSSLSIIKWSTLLTGIFMILIILPSHQGALWITLFLAGAAVTINFPACTAMVSHAASPTEQGRVLGNNQSLQVAAEALSAVLGGFLASIAINFSLLVFGIFACVTAGLLFILRPKV